MNTKANMTHNIVRTKNAVSPLPSDEDDDWDFFHITFEKRCPKKTCAQLELIGKIFRTMPDNALDLITLIHEYVLMRWDHDGGVTVTKKLSEIVNESPEAENGADILENHSTPAKNETESSHNGKLETLQSVSTIETMTGMVY